jgi:hypothetical protein
MELMNLLMIVIVEVLGDPVLQRILELVAGMVVGFVAVFAILRMTA